MPEKVSLYNSNLVEKIRNTALSPKFVDERIKQVTECIFGNSPYLSEIIIKYPEFFINCFDDGFENIFSNLINEIERAEYKEREEIEAGLRKNKAKAALLIAVGEICGEFTGSVAMRHLSEFADLCVKKAAEFLLIDYHNKKQINLPNSNNPIENTGLV
ncbi:MAG TPA: hypothetical protein DIV86_04100, partial [Alphaproteobacteria bacterium]|nr:hypothetical protein [Alphaproteobacteria bacterium]